MCGSEGLAKQNEAQAESQRSQKVFDGAHSKMRLSASGGLRGTSHEILYVYVGGHNTSASGGNVTLRQP